MTAIRRVGHPLHPPGNHHVAQPRLAPFGLAAEVLAVVVLPLVQQRLHRESHFAVLGIDVDDLDLDFLALLNHVARVFYALFLELGYVNEPLDSLLDLDEGAEVGHFGDLALQPTANRQPLRERLPRILLQLLDSEAEALIFGVDVEHHRLHFVPLLVQLSRMLDSLGPRNVGDVNEAIHPLFNADENSEIGHVANLPFDHRANRIFVLEQRPGVGLGLLHPEGNALGLGVDVQHHRLDLFAHLEHLRRVLNSLGPGHLRHVHQAFDALFQLNEGAVVGDADHFAADPRSNWILLVRSVPGVLLNLFETERNAFDARIELQNHHLDLVPHVEAFGRMADSPPRHVGNVQKAVNPAQVDEGAVVGEVFHDPLQHRALGQIL